MRKRRRKSSQAQAAARRKAEGPPPSKPEPPHEPPRPKERPKERRERAFYPAFIDLHDKSCVVVGGGRVAERKVEGLLEAGANRLKVVSPNLTKELERKKNSGAIKHSRHHFTPVDLRGAYLVIAATDSPEENRRIAGAAENMGIPLINAVDMPERCNFIVPASLRRGPLAIAVSTSGASPAMAAAIREELEGLYGPAFGQYLRTLERERARAMERIKNPEDRERFLKSLASDTILKTLREGRQPGLRRPRRRPPRKTAEPGK